MIKEVNYLILVANQLEQRSQKLILAYRFDPTLLCSYELQLQLGV